MTGEKVAAFVLMCQHCLRPKCKIVCTQSVKFDHVTAPRERRRFCEILCVHTQGTRLSLHRNNLERYARQIDARTSDSQGPFDERDALRPLIHRLDRPGHERGIPDTRGTDR